MRFIVLWIFLSSGMAFANENQCIFGNPKRDLHAKNVAGFGVAPDSFLEAYIRHKERKTCSPYYLQARNLANFLTTKLDMRHGIERECIRESMMNIPNITNTYRADCENDRQGVSSRRSLRSGRKYDTCLTENMVDYVHFAIQETTNCINSISEYPIDPMILFKKFNRESAFGYYLQSERGSGVGQLTSIAMKEMAMKQHDGKVYIERALESQTCSKFHNMLAKPIDFPSLNGEKVVRICQLVNSQDGLARNLFFSMALFSHNRDTHRSAIGVKMRKLGIYDETTINYMTLISYGRNGLAHAEAALEQLVNTFGYEYLETLSAERVLVKIKALDKTPNDLSDTLENIRKHYGDEHNKVLTTDDILEYLEKHEPAVLTELLDIPGVAAIIGQGHEAFLKKLKEISPYVREIEQSYKSFQERVAKRGVRECFRPFAFQ